jgi:hypothetical protein
MLGYPSSREEAIQRLEHAAKFIAAVPPDQFTMEHWWLEDGKYHDYDRGTVEEVAVGPCGCAVGHMVHRELFDLHSGVLRESRQRIFVILGDLFGLSYKEAEFLFDQYAYSLRRKVLPSDVVRRIEFMISEVRASE